MNRYSCKVCFRSFANGSALGGHMRSHIKYFHVSKYKTSENIDDLQSSESYSSISSQYLSPKDDEKQVDPEFSSVLIQDRESDTDSSKDHCIRRMSKRVRHSRTWGFSRFATPEEDVAFCLMMLSRDKWERDGKKSIFCGERGDFCGDSDVSKVRKNTKIRGKYRCETCNKLFKSYQALGGHMASHKKMIRHSPFNNESSETADSGGGSARVVEEEKVHECPFCDRVFSSGQALGGHKRSHFTRGIGGISRTNFVRPVGSPVESTTRIGEDLKIDLNLSAPVHGEPDKPDRGFSGFLPVNLCAQTGVA